jgi:hypothetical protein
MADDTPPVLFFDIDEVVCFGRVALAMPGGDKIDPVSAAMIVRICEKTGARIVVTSTWRCSPVRCKAMFDAHGITPHLWSPIVLPDDDADDVDDLRDHPSHDDDRDAWRVQSQNSSRSAAIDHWLDLHPQVKVWAIVDDSFQDFDQHKLGRLVHTDMMFGLGVREYSRAVRLLSGKAALKVDEFAGYQNPRHTISNLAIKALAALDQGDDDAARALLAIIRDEPLAQ